MMTRSALLIGTLLATVSVAMPVHADSRTLASSGLWSTYGGTDAAGHNVCGMVTVGGDGRRIDISQSVSDGGIELALQKDSWGIPANTSIDMQVQFDRNNAMPAQGVGDGRRVMARMNFEQSVPFMRALRNGTQIRVYFPNGNEPVWTGGLSGSGRAIDAFNECRSNLMAATPTQPYANAAPVTQAASQPASGPTQPFAVPPNAPPAQFNGLPPLPPPS